MRSPTTNICLTAIAASALLFSACAGVKYPKCEKDDDCQKNAAGEVIEEFCVNQQCQECREDAQCGVGKECKNFRCERTEGWCASDADCSGGKTCQESACVEVQCASDDDCQAGETCDDGTCTAAGCVSDQECSAGEQCQSGECVPSTSNISSGCQPMGGTNDVIGLATVSFEFNDDALTVNTRSGLDENAECLRQAPNVTLVVEGHCDERGTQEYNLALGERRANAVKSYLKNLGVDTSRMRTVSKGKNQPVCHQSSEACHAKNRRVMFLQKRSGGF